MNCRLCGHDVSLGALGPCGTSSVTLPDGRTVWLCHADDHSCYHRWTVYGDRPGRPSDETLHERIIAARDRFVTATNQAAEAFRKLSGSLTPEQWAEVRRSGRNYDKHRARIRHVPRRVNKHGRKGVKR